MADGHKYKTFSKSTIPLFGALIDCLETSFQYLWKKSLVHVDKFHEKSVKSSLSSKFLAAVCLSLGLACNIKFEVIKNDDEPLNNDMHEVLISKEDHLYVDDIDPSGVLCCLDASDFIVVMFSCFLILYSSKVKSSLREYLFLPWMGAALRGLLFRQVPTAVALLYTIAVVEGNLNPLFLTQFCFLLLLEARLWMEIARLVRGRWERRMHSTGTHVDEYEVETLWSNDEVESVEMRNYVY